MQSKQSWSHRLQAGAVLLVVVPLAGMTGCADKNKDSTPEVQLPSQQEVAQTANKVGQSVENAAGQALVAGEEGIITAKVKTALLANKALDANQMNVDVKGNTVILRGRVKNPTQKKLAQSIAAREAPKYQMINQLQVTGGASPVMKKAPAGAKK